jgi:transcriptional regulator with XRE-family HTH domain
MTENDYDHEEPEEPKIGAFLRQSRKDRLMSQAEVAKRAGISRTHLGGIECGHSEPSYRVARAVCSALGVEPWQTWRPEPDVEAIDRLASIENRLTVLRREVQHALELSELIVKVCAGLITEGQLRSMLTDLENQPNQWGIKP